MRYSVLREGSDVMTTELGVANTLGFRHLLEDGLAILRGADLSVDRRAFVLQDLKQLVSDATRGSDLAQTGALFVAPHERSAYATFSLLDRYLSDKYADHLKEMLQAAEMSFDEFRRQAPHVTESARKAAETLLLEMLSHLQRDPRPGIPQEPEDIFTSEATS